MKQQQVIMGSITATLSAMALGYVGVQYLNQNAMYTIAGAMLGLGATTQITQLKSKSQVSPTEESLQPSVPVVAVSEEPPQPVQPVQPVQPIQPIQPIQSTYQTIEPKIEHPVEIIESDTNQELIAEIDPIIKRFVTVGLEDF